ncbi:MAG TPA: glycosyltransferase family 2 protein [Acidimicrobiales bacterium]|nr:glycosyltransferase family 2 protein [Acidimicrobiales bacterium]
MTDAPGHDPDGRTLSVIVPVFNERNTVVEVLRRMRRVELPVNLEIVVVDDGSTDGTSQILAALEDSTVQVVRHPSNLGKGAAIRTALGHVRGELVLIQDADLEYDPEDWPRLLRPVLRGRSQVVYGSRFSGEGKSMPASDWVGNRALSLTTNLLFNTSLSDMECGYKLFTRKVLDDITIESDRFDFEPEITAKVLRRGYRIYEVPVSYSGRPASEGRKFAWRDGVRAVGTLVRYRWARLP